MTQPHDKSIEIDDVTDEETPTPASDDAIEAEWTLVDTPGSDVELEKLPDPQVEDTTHIDDDDETAPVSVAEVDETTLSAAVASDLGIDEGDVPTSVYSPRRLYREQAATRSVEQEAERLAAEEAEAEAQRDEAERIEAERRAEAERLAAEKAARNRALGVVASSGAQLEAPARPHKLVTDKFLGAFGLFVFRVIIAGVLGVRAYQMLTDMTAWEAQVTPTRLPETAIMAWVSAVSMLALALALLLGAFVRVAGLGLAVISGLALAFVRWGQFSPFVAGQYGFFGELELVLAGAGLVFCCLGGGRWGVDGAFRSSRAKAKEAREA